MYSCVPSLTTENSFWLQLLTTQGEGTHRAGSRLLFTASLTLLPFGAHPGGVGTRSDYRTASGGQMWNWTRPKSIRVSSALSYASGFALPLPHLQLPTAPPWTPFTSLRRREEEEKRHRPWRSHGAYTCLGWSVWGPTLLLTAASRQMPSCSLCLATTLPPDRRETSGSLPSTCS